MKQDRDEPDSKYKGVKRNHKEINKIYAANKRYEQKAALLSGHN